MKFLLRGIAAIACLCVIFVQLSCTIKVIPDIKSSANMGIDVSKSTTSEETLAPHLLNPGDIITDGGYIELSGVTFQYNGDSQWSVVNNRDDIIMVECHVVGTKIDGTYEELEDAGFAGVDQTKYDNDFSANGWAVKHYTNMARPGETLNAELSVYDFGDPKPDINDDGYYEIIFIVRPQIDESSISISDNDPKSDIYKLPVAN